jgi:hypothetical protein
MLGGRYNVLNEDTPEGQDRQRPVVESVKTDVPSLVKRVLSKYPSDLFYLRELIQNADDAKATTVGIRLIELGHATYKSPQQPYPTRFEKLIVENNGRKLSADDQDNLTTIGKLNHASSDRVGMFGIGFYSVFAISDSPIVDSGNLRIAFQFPPAHSGKLTYNVTTRKDYRGFRVILPLKIDHQRMKVEEMAKWLMWPLLAANNLTSLTLRINERTVFEVQKHEKCIDVHGLQMKSGHMMQLQLQVDRLDITNARIKEDYRFLTVDKVLAPPQRELKAQISAVEQKTGKSMPTNITYRIIVDEPHYLNGAWGEVSPQQLERGGSVILGNYTDQTTGALFHLASNAFIATAERVALDYHEPAYQAWNQTLMYKAGQLLRTLYNFQIQTMDVPDAISDHTSWPALIAAGVQGSQHGETVVENQTTALLPAGCEALLPWLVGISLLEPTHPHSSVHRDLARGFKAGSLLVPCFTKGKFRIVDATSVRMIPKELQGFEAFCSDAYIPASLLKGRVRDFYELHCQDDILEWTMTQMRAKTWSETQASRALQMFLRRAHGNGNPQDCRMFLDAITVTTPHARLADVKFYANPQLRQSGLLLPQNTLTNNIASCFTEEDLQVSFGLECLYVQPWWAHIAGNEELLNSMLKDPRPANKLMSLLHSHLSEFGDQAREVVGVLSTKQCIQAECGGMKIMCKPSEVIALAADDGNTPTKLPKYLLRKFNTISPNKQGHLLHFYYALGVHSKIPIEQLIEKADFFQNLQEIIVFIVDSLYPPLSDAQRQSFCSKAFAFVSKDSLGFVPSQHIQGLSFELFPWSGDCLSQYQQFLADELELPRHPSLSQLLIMISTLGCNKQAVVNGLEYLNRFFTENNYYQELDADRLDTDSYRHICFLPSTNGPLISPALCCLASNPFSEWIVEYHPTIHRVAKHFDVADHPSISSVLDTLIDNPIMDLEQSMRRFAYAASRLTEFTSEQSLRLQQSKFVPFEGKFCKPITLFLEPSSSSISLSPLFRYFAPSRDNEFQAIALLRYCGIGVNPTVDQQAQFLVKSHHRLVGNTEAHNRVLNNLQTNWSEVSAESKKLLAHTRCFLSATSLNFISAKECYIRDTTAAIYMGACTRVDFAPAGFFPMYLNCGAQRVSDVMHCDLEARDRMAWHRCAIAAERLVYHRQEFMLRALQTIFPSISACFLSQILSRVSFSYAQTTYQSCLFPGGDLFELPPNRYALQKQPHDCWEIIVCSHLDVQQLSSCLADILAQCLPLDVLQLSEKILYVLSMSVPSLVNQYPDCTDMQCFEGSMRIIDLDQRARKLQRTMAAYIRHLQTRRAARLHLTLRKLVISQALRRWFRQTKLERKNDSDDRNGQSMEETRTEENEEDVVVGGSAEGGIEAEMGWNESNKSDRIVEEEHGDHDADIHEEEQGDSDRDDNYESLFASIAHQFDIRTGGDSAEGTFALPQQSCVLTPILLSIPGEITSIFVSETSISDVGRGEMKQWSDRGTTSRLQRQYPNLKFIKVRFGRRVTEERMNSVLTCGVRNNDKIFRFLASSDSLVSSLDRPSPSTTHVARRCCSCGITDAYSSKSGKVWQ